MFRTTFNLLLLLLLHSSVPFVLGQDFPCGDPEAAEELPDIDFTAITLGANCKFNEKTLVPKTINWHVYVLPENEVPKYSMYPPNFAKPKTSGNALEFDYEDTLKGTYSNGMQMEAGVYLYIPINQMKRVNVVTVGQNVEVIADDLSFNGTSFYIQDSGVDNRLIVNSPFSSVDYHGSGVDSTTVLSVASGSTVDLSGVDNDLQIKTAGDDLEVSMSGVDQRVLIDGEYSQIKMSGVNTNVRVNGESRCDHVSSSGVDNNCSPSNENVTVPELDCLAKTKATSNYCSWFGMTQASAIGLGVAIVVVVVAAFAACCFFCHRRRRNLRGTDLPQINNVTAEKEHAPSAPPTMAFATTLPPKSAEQKTNPVVEAEVLEIKDGNAHAFAQKDDEELEEVDMANEQGDIEQNKGGKEGVMAKTF